MSDGGRLVVGDDGVVWAGEVEDESDADGFPPERERGLGGGGFIRVDGHLESEGSGGSPIAARGGRRSLAAAGTACSSGLAASRVGSDRGGRLPADTPEPLLSWLGSAAAGVIGGGGTCPVNINCLKASTSRDCRLHPSLPGPYDRLTAKAA